MPEVGAELNRTWLAQNAQSPQTPTRRPSATSFDFGHAYDPNRHHPGARPAPRERRRAPVRLLAGIACVVGSAVAAFAVQTSGNLDRDSLATWLGFGIEQVSLTGHRFTPDADLFAALDLKSARSLASFDAPGIRQRFERLPWVQSVEISRVWPGQLAIRVTERKPFAIWERGETAELIDATGRQLGPVKSDAILDLPRIAGEGANETAAQLLTALGRYPALKSKVVRARRLADRRWTLDLASGGQIHLPSDGEVSALARLASEPQFAAQLDTAAQIIDLRSPSKIAIRTPAAPPGKGG